MNVNMPSSNLWGFVLRNVLLSGIFQRASEESQQKTEAKIYMANGSHKVVTDYITMN